MNPAVMTHTGETRLSLAADRLIAFIPIVMWSVFCFGARVVSFYVIALLVCFGLDYAVQRFLFRAPAGVRVDPYCAVCALAAVFTMPVAAPMWVPALAAALAVFAKNVHYRDTRRILNPIVFPAAVLNLLFRGVMTGFTRPFAYFSAFSFSLDSALVDRYRVISPLQYSANGSVYENGLGPQFFGAAAGNIGEVAVLAILLGSVWLFIKKAGDFRPTLAFLTSIFILAYIFPSDNAEAIYYVFGTLLSGGVIFLGVHAINEGTSAPYNTAGKVISAAVCGVLLFILRKAVPGYECGYIVILAAGALSPLIEKLTKPRVLGTRKKAKR